MIKLEKGAKVKVRLHTGEVVEAVYDEPDVDNKMEHWVYVNGRPFLAAKNYKFYGGCRFVGNPCDLVPVGVSV